MNKDMVLGLVRHIITGIGSIFVAKGVVDSATLEALVGALAVIVGGIWSIVDKKQ